jgi:hypothetical protein
VKRLRREPYFQPLSAFRARRPRVYTGRVYLLCYVRGGETRFVIVDGWSMMHARLFAARLNLGKFVQGHPIEPTIAAHVLPHAVGRVLTRAEVLAMFELKKDSAPGVLEPE